MMHKSQKREHSRSKASKQTLDEKLEKSVKVMDIVLIVVGILLISFTITMIIVFVATGSIPDTLVGCVFAACTGELGIMGWIKSTKDKYYDRELNKEVMNRAKAIQINEPDSLSQEVDFFE